MNLIKSHPFFTSHVELHNLIAPLKRYNINYFTYRKFYTDNTRVFLGTRPDWLETFFTKKWYINGNTEADPKLYRRQAVLWATLPNQQIFQAARELGIDHGIYLIYPGPDYCEFFAFATTPNHPDTLNFYLNNLDVLENFTLFFRDQAKPLIAQIERHKIVLPYHQLRIEHYRPNDTVNTTKEIDIKRLNFKVSPRKMDCMTLLLTGATTKEMAIKLNLSHRTIEDYVNFLKQKFHARNKADLVSKISSFRVRDEFYSH